MTDQPEPGPNGPIANPVDKFAHLPAPTRAWLESLRADDIALLMKLMTTYERAETIGWFAKWLFITMVAAFVGAVTFGEKVATAISWFRAGR